MYLTTVAEMHLGIFCSIHQSARPNHVCNCLKGLQGLHLLIIMIILYKIMLSNHRIGSGAQREFINIFQGGEVAKISKICNKA